MEDSTHAIKPLDYDLVDDARQRAESSLADVQLQLNNYKSACRDLSVTQVMEVFSRLERTESALAEARNKVLDEAADACVFSGDRILIVALKVQP